MKNTAERKVVSLTLRLAPEERALRSKEKAGKQPKLHLVPRHKGKFLSLIACAFLMTSCTGTYAGSHDLALLGTEEGLARFTEMQAALITEGKSSPDVKSAFWQNREKEILLKIKVKPQAGGGK